jgi:tol-pal system protein YbgF
MKRSYGLILLIPSLLLLGSGCASHRQVAEVSMQVEQVRKDHTQIKATLAHLDTLLTQQSDAQKRLNAELKLSMGAIEERMLLVEQRMEDLGGQITQTGLRRDVSRPRSEPADSADSTKTPGQVDQLKLYQLAYADLTKGNYKMAISGFEELLKQHPTSALADNAVYWIAECHYIQKSYAEAQTWYGKLIKDYSKSEHVSSAKYKLGMSLYNQQFKTKAKQYFQDVVKDYPGTEEANKAAEMLNRY